MTDLPLRAKLPSMIEMYPPHHKVSLLLDFYGELLPPGTRDLMDLSYNQDLSLAEIADQRGTSRQAVSDGLKRGEKNLQHYEDTLGLAEDYLELLRLLDQLDRNLADADIDAARETARSLRTLTD